jgi:hypothetical protein
MVEVLPSRPVVLLLVSVLARSDVLCVGRAHVKSNQRQRQNRKVAMNSSYINSNNKYIPDWDTPDLVWIEANHLKL